MFELTIGTGLDRKKVPCDLTATLKEALIENDVDYSIGTLHLDGASLRPGDLDKTFAELGVRDSAILIAVVKGDAA